MNNKKLSTMLFFKETKRRKMFIREISYNKKRQVLAAWLRKLFITKIYSVSGYADYGFIEEWHKQ